MPVLQATGKDKDNGQDGNAGHGQDGNAGHGQDGNAGHGQDELGRTRA